MADLDMELDLSLDFDLDTEALIEEPPVLDHEVPVPGRKRLSVSAIRDYHKCPRYYKLKRIDKLEEEKKHYLAAGTTVHNAFYMAYGTPVETYDIERDRMKVEWRVSGDFDPGRALQMYDLLYWRSVNTRGERVPDSDEPIPPDLQQAFAILNEDTDVIENFTRGRKKILKSDSQEELRKGWYQHYREMLEKSLQEPLPYPVKDIERQIQFVLGGNPMVAYIDLVLDAGSGYEVFVDLKTGQTKPGAKELFLDDQAATYYYAGGEDVQDFVFYYMNAGARLAVDRNHALLDTLPQMAEDVAINIQNGHFPRAYEKQRCSYCPFRKECLGG